MNNLTGHDTLIFGIIIPSIVFCFSFFITYALYAHFMRVHGKKQ